MTEAIKKITYELDSIKLKACKDNDEYQRKLEHIKMLELQLELLVKSTPAEEPPPVVTPTPEII